MAKFVIGTPIETADPVVEVTLDPANPLPPGRHRFRLVVQDDDGILSDPSEVDVVVRDAHKPTAVLEAPPQVLVGRAFELSGRNSTDTPPGKIVKYIWTLVQ